MKHAFRLTAAIAIATSPPLIAQNTHHPNSKSHVTVSYTKGFTGCGNPDYGYSDLCPLEEFDFFSFQAAIAITPNFRFHAGYEGFEESFSKYNIHYSVGGIGETHDEISVKTIALGLSYSFYQDLWFLPAYTFGLSILKDIERFHTTVIQENSTRIYDDRVNAEFLEVAADASAMFLEGIETGLSLRYELPLGGSSTDVFGYREPSNEFSVGFFIKAHMDRVALGCSVELNDDFTGASASLSYFF